MLNQGERLTLNDNKKYTVVSSINYNNKNYVYLIDQDDYLNTMLCEFDNNNELEEVSDPALIEELIKLFMQLQNY